MKRVITTVLALSLFAAGSAAMANPHAARGRQGHAHSRSQDSHHSAPGRHEGPTRGASHASHGSPHSRAWASHHAAPVVSRGRVVHPVYRAPAPARWRVGARLPRTYIVNRYVVRDYGHYRLRQPPRGMEWVRVNNDVLLTAITTGLVVEVVHDLFH